MQKPVAKRKKEISLFLGSLFFSLLIACIVIEVWQRVQYHNYHTEMAAKYEGRDLCTRESGHPGLVYERKPGKCGANSQGFIDREHPFSKPKGTRRLMLIGDSVAEGSGVNPENAFGSVLERLLNEYSSNNASPDGNNTAQKWEVITLAVTGYTTDQELVLLRDYSLQYDPDQIIWSYVLNDPEHPVYQSANAELGLYYFKPFSFALNFFQRKIYYTTKRAGSRGCPDEYHAKIHCINRDQINSNIGEIGRFSLEHKIPMLFIVHPVFEKSGFSNYSLHQVHKSLTQMAFAAGLDTLDLITPFSALSVNELRQSSQDSTWFDPWHPNEKGHLIIAQTLAQRLLKEI